MKKQLSKDIIIIILSRILLSFFFFLLISVSVFAQANLTGLLKDEKGLPVINLNVRLISDNGTKIALSDIDGNFQFKDVHEVGVQIFPISALYISL